MKEFSNVSQFINSQPSIVTIGTFDGVHLGHKTILKRLVETAKKEKLHSVVLTFFPHPRMVLKQDHDIKLINTIGERTQLLEKTGIDYLVVHPFTTEFSQLTALEFVRDILVNRLNTKKIIIGYDHRFGRNRSATIEDLKKFGEKFGFEVDEISAKEVDDVAISSTKIRKALDHGDIETANAYLGYPFMLSGNVVRGRAIGRTLTYPTANIHVEAPYKLIPRNGVYVVKSRISNKTVYGITSIGTNPTVGGKEKTIETFFLDFEGNLYDRNLCLEFLTHLREEAVFDSLGKLIEAIKEDESRARQFLKSHE